MKKYKQNQYHFDKAWINLLDGKGVAFQLYGFQNKVERQANLPSDMISSCY